MPNHKLTAVDAANFLPRKFPPLVAQVLFGLALALAMIGLRTLIDIVAPNAGPFALVYPMVLIATLFVAGRSLQVFYQIPFAMVQLIQAVLVICVASSDFFIRHRIRRVQGGE